MESFVRAISAKALSAPLTVALCASVAVLATAYFFQYALGYQPCDLCYYQRYPYMAVIFAAALGHVLPQRTNSIQTALLILVGLLFLLDAGIAIFHVGVEQGWWEGPTTCSGGAFTQGSVEDVLAQIKAAAPVRCDEPAWTLFGISFAGFNVFIAGALAVFSLVALRGRKGI